MRNQNTTTAAMSHPIRALRKKPALSTMDMRDGGLTVFSLCAEDTRSLGHLYHLIADVLESIARAEQLAVAA